MSRVWPFGLLLGVRVSNMLVSGLWLGQKKTIVSGLRARQFKTSASMFFLNLKKKKNPLVFLQKSM